MTSTLLLDKKDEKASDAAEATAILVEAALGGAKPQPLPGHGPGGATEVSGVLVLKQRVASQLAEIISRAGYRELAAVGYASPLGVFDVKRPDIQQLAREASDELFGAMAKTAGGRVQRALARELGEKQDPFAIAEALRSQFAGVSRRQARMVARTAVRDLYNQAALNAYEYAGITHVIASDGHGGLTGQTDPACLDRNGKTFTISEARELRAYHPTVHPNCTLGFRPIVPEGGVNPPQLPPVGGSLSDLTATIPAEFDLTLSWTPDEHPRWPKGTPGVDKHGHSLAGEFFGVADIVRMLHATVTDTADLSFLAKGSQHVQSIEVQPGEKQKYDGSPDSLRFSVVLKHPKVKALTQIQFEIANLQMIKDVAGDHPAATGPAFVDFLKDLDDGTDLASAKSKLTSKIGKYLTAKKGQWAVTLTYKSKKGWTAYEKAANSQETQAQHLAVGDHFNPLGSTQTFKVTDPLPSYPHIMVQEVDHKGNAKGDPFNVENAKHVVKVPKPKTKFEGLEIKLSSAADAGPHDPSITLPDNAHLSPEQWLRFGKKDQQRYVELHAKYGKWNNTKGKTLLQSEYSKRHHAIVAKVEAAFTAHYGGGGTSSESGTQYGALSLKAAAKIPQSDWDAQAKTVDPEGKFSSWAEAMNDLLLSHEDVVQWDAYNRVGDPEVILNHAGKSSYQSTSSFNLLVNQGKTIAGGYSWAADPSGWDEGGDAIIAKVAIRNLTMSHAVRLQSIHGGELEWSSRYNMKPDFDNMIITTGGTGSQNKSAVTSAMYSGTKGVPVGGNKWIDVVKASGHQPHGGPVSPEEFYKNFASMKAEKLDVGDKFVDVEDWKEHKVKAIKGGVVTTKDGFVLNPDDDVKLIKKSPPPVGMLEQVAAKDIPKSAKIYDENTGDWNGYLQWPVGSGNSEDNTKVTVKWTKGTQADTKTQYDADHLLWTVLPADIEDLDEGQEFFQPGSKGQTIVKVTSVDDAQKVVKTNTGNSYPFGTQVVPEWDKSKGKFAKGEKKPSAPVPDHAVTAAAGDTPLETKPKLTATKTGMLDVGDHVYAYKSEKYLGQVTSIGAGLVQITNPDGSKKNYAEKTSVKKGAHAPNTPSPTPEIQPDVNEAQKGLVSIPWGVAGVDSLNVGTALYDKDGVHIGDVVNSYAGSIKFKAAKTGSVALDYGNGFDVGTPPYDFHEGEETSFSLAGYPLEMFTKPQADDEKAFDAWNGPQKPGVVTAKHTIVKDKKLISEFLPGDILWGNTSVEDEWEALAYVSAKTTDGTTFTYYPDSPINPGETKTFSQKNGLHADIAIPQPVAPSEKTASDYVHPHVKEIKLGEVMVGDVVANKLTGAPSMIATQASSIANGSYMIFTYLPGMKSDPKLPDTTELPTSASAASIPFYVLKPEYADLVKPTVAGQAPSAPGPGSKKAYLLDEGTYVWAYSSGKFIGQIIDTDGTAAGKVTVKLDNGGTKTYSGGTTFKYAKGSVADTADVKSGPLDLSAAYAWTPENLNGLPQDAKIGIGDLEYGKIKGQIPGTATFQVVSEGPYLGAKLELDFDPATTGANGQYVPEVVHGISYEVGESLQKGDMISIPSTGELAKVSVAPNYPDGGIAVSWNANLYDLDPYDSYTIVAKASSAAKTKPVTEFKEGDKFILAKSGGTMGDKLGETFTVTLGGSKLIHAQDEKGNAWELGGVLSHGIPLTDGEPPVPGVPEGSHDFAWIADHAKKGDQFTVTGSTAGTLVGKTYTVKDDPTDGSFFATEEGSTAVIGWGKGLGPAYHAVFHGAPPVEPTGEAAVEKVAFGVEAPLGQQDAHVGDAFIITDHPNKALLGDAIQITELTDTGVKYKYLTGHGAKHYPDADLEANNLLHGLVAKKIPHNPDVPQKIEEVAQWAKPGDVLVLDASGPHANKAFHDATFTVEKIENGIISGTYGDFPNAGDDVVAKSLPGSHFEFATHASPMLFSKPSTPPKPLVSLDSFQEGAKILVADKPGTVGKTINDVTLVQFDDGTSDIFTNNIALAYAVDPPPGATQSVKTLLDPAAVKQTLADAPHYDSVDMDVIDGWDVNVGDVMYTAQGFPNAVVTKKNDDGTFLVIDSGGHVNKQWSGYVSFSSAQPSTSTVPEYVVGNKVEKTDVGKLPPGSVVVFHSAHGGAIGHNHWVKIGEDGTAHWILPGKGGDGIEWKNMGIDSVGSGYTFLGGASDEHLPLTTQEADAKVIDAPPLLLNTEKIPIPENEILAGHVLYTKTGGKLGVVQGTTSEGYYVRLVNGATEFREWGHKPQGYMIPNPGIGDSDTPDNEPSIPMTQPGPLPSAVPSAFPPGHEHPNVINIGNLDVGDKFKIYADEQIGNFNAWFNQATAVITNKNLQTGKITYQYESLPNFQGSNLAQQFKQQREVDFTKRQVHKIEPDAPTNPGVPAQDPVAPEPESDVAATLAAAPKVKGGDLKIASAQDVAMGTVTYSWDGKPYGVVTGYNTDGTNEITLVSGETINLHSFYVPENEPDAPTGDDGATQAGVTAAVGEPPAVAPPGSKSKKAYLMDVGTTVYSYHSGKLVGTIEAKNEDEGTVVVSLANGKGAKTYKASTTFKLASGGAASIPSTPPAGAAPPSGKVHPSKLKPGDTFDESPWGKGTITEVHKNESVPGTWHIGFVKESGAKDYWSTYPDGKEFLYPVTPAAGTKDAPEPAPTGPVSGLNQWIGIGPLTVTGSAGGTQGAVFAKAKNGEKYVIKQYAGDDDRVWTEAISNALYAAAGAPVPEGGTILHEGKLAYASKFIPGSTKHSWPKSEVLGQHFAVDAWLANWDVVGADYDNILWNNGVPYRVDVGGSLGYRAMGKKKPFTDDAAEVNSMLEPGRQAEKTMIVNAIQQQLTATNLMQLVANGTVAAIVNSSGLSPAAKKKLIATLTARAKKIDQHFNDIHFAQHEVTYQQPQGNVVTFTVAPSEIHGLSQTDVTKVLLDKLAYKKLIQPF